MKSFDFVVIFLKPIGYISYHIVLSHFVAYRGEKCDYKSKY